MKKNTGLNLIEKIELSILINMGNTTQLNSVEYKNATVKYHEFSCCIKTTYKTRLKINTINDVKIIEQYVKKVPGRYTFDVEFTINGKKLKITEIFEVSKDFKQTGSIIYIKNKGQFIHSLHGFGSFLAFILSENREFPAWILDCAGDSWY